MPSSLFTPERAVHATTLALTLLLVSCGHVLPRHTLTAGTSQRGDGIASQGAPSRLWPEADGGSTLEYSTQPFG